MRFVGKLQPIEGHAGRCATLNGFRGCFVNNGVWGTLLLMTVSSSFVVGWYLDVWLGWRRGVFVGTLVLAVARPARCV